MTPAPPAAGPESRLNTLGLSLPPPFSPPGAARFPFPMVIVHDKRVLISGHGPQQADGSLPGRLGKVGADLDLEQACQAARMVGLSMLGNLQRTLGSLDKIARWVRVFGMVNAVPGFQQHPAVINGFSDLILDIYGHHRGLHARSAIGVASLPFNIPVEIEAEVELY